MKPQGTQLSLFETRSSSDPFAVRVSPRARRLTARVHVGRPRGNRRAGRRQCPRGARFRAALHALDQPQGRRDAVLSSLPASPCRASSSLHSRAKIWAWNGAAAPGAGSSSTPAGIAVQAPDDPAARGLLQGWLKAAAEERLAPRLLQLAAELKYPVSRVSIRCQRTRWGSCSTRGTVSLNCSLVFLRPEVVRYLFIHELAHTKHMNHSASFWRLVEKLEPDYRRLDRELLAGWRTVPGWVFKS